MRRERNRRRAPASARRTLALAASLLVAAAAGAEPRWLGGRSEHFEVLSGVGAERTQELAGELERFRAFVLRITNASVAASSVPTRVVIFEDEDEFARLRPRSRVSGFFFAAEQANYLVVDASRAEASLQIAKHEFTHFLLASHTQVVYPPWYSEGFAELLSTAVVAGPVLEVGRAPVDRVRWLLSATPLPLSRVLGGREVMSWSRHALSSFYAQSWALTHYLHWGDQLGFPSRRDQMLRYLARVSAGAEPEAAAQEAFGVDVETLEGELLAYLAKKKLPYRRLAGSALAEPRAAELVPVAYAERDARLAEVALALGDSRFDAAERWLERALERDPAQPLARVSSAWLAAQRGGAPDLAGAEAAAAGDPALEVRLGDIFLAEARRQGSPELLLRAAALFERHRESSGAAAIGLAHVALAQGDAGRAAAELGVARQRLPTLVSLDLELARLQVAAGRQGEAQQSLRRVLAQPHREGDDLPQAEIASLLEHAGLALRGDEATRHLEARLDLFEPAPAGEVRTGVPLVEVRGRGGLWEAGLHDLVIVFDESGSTLRASGVDIDGDGRVGKTRPLIQCADPRRQSSDPGDSILKAEVDAARRLLERLDASTTRVAVVAFAGSARVLAPLGAPAAALAAVQEYGTRIDFSGTSLAFGLGRAFRELFEGRDELARRQRTILLLSDGQPTVPDVRSGRQQAREVAEQLAELGVRVHTFGLGEEAARRPETYQEIARVTGGRSLLLDEPGEVIEWLGDVRLTGLDRVAMRNLRTGEEGRAVRIFPDGSFDGFVGLAPGANPIEVVAFVSEREPVVLQRSVFLDEALLGTPAAAGAAASLLERLRERTTAVELAAEARAKRRAQRRELTIEAGPAPAPEAPPESATR